METETLSSKIGDYRLFRSETNKRRLKLLNVEDVKDFIHQLKATLCSEAIEREKHISDPSLDRLPLSSIVKKIDKLAGDALIYSPELAKKTGTPDDMGICNPGNSSGTHSQQDGGLRASKHTGSKGEVGVIKPGASLPAGTSDKIGCTNHHNLPSRIEHGDKSEELPSDFYKENLRELYEIMKKEGITTIEQLEKRFGRHNPACTNQETEMYCAVEGCGRVDDTHTAYCIKHGRSTHRMRSKTNHGITKVIPERGSDKTDCTKSKGCGKRFPCKHPYCDKLSHKCGKIKDKYTKSVHLCPSCDNQNRTNSK